MNSTQLILRLKEEVIPAVMAAEGWRERDVETVREAINAISDFEWTLMEVTGRHKEPR